MAIYAALVASLFAASNPAPTAGPFRVEVEGQGPPVILIPGLMSSGDVWRDLVAHYRGHYQFHTFTLAGFAGVPSSEGEFLAVERDAILRYIEDQKLDRPVVVGHSLGGFLALWMAATAPGRVGKVVTVDGVPFLPALLDPSATVDSVRSQAARMKAMYDTATPEQLDAQSRFALQTMIREPDQVARAAEWAATSDPKRIGQAVNELMTTDIRAELVRVKAPVLMVAAAPAGLDPGSVKQRYAAQLARCAHAQVEVASGSRHFVMLDDPAFLYEAIDRFLASAPVEGGQ